MNWPMRVVRLASDPRESGLWCGTEGLRLGGKPLLKLTATGFMPPSPFELQGIFDATYGNDNAPEAESYLGGLRSVARSLNKGDVPLAMIGSLLLKLPDIPEPPHAEAQNSDWGPKLAFDHDQARDANGRWIQGSGSEALQVPQGDIGTKPPAFTSFEVESTGVEGVEAIAPTVIGLLGRLAAVIAAPVALAAGILIPTNRSNIHSGTIPGAPGLTYRSDEGIVTISRLDASGNIEHLYHGAPDEDGFYHDATGNIIGRIVGNGELFDSDTLAALAAQSKKPSVVGADASDTPASAPRQEDDEPKICPPPSVENNAGRSARTIAYQSQMTGLLPGFDVEYRGVRFDGCDKNTGRMIEAKGLGTGWILNRSYDDLIETKFYTDMMGQAKNQNEAARDRGDDYYFADERVGNFFKTEFERAGYRNIIVHHVEAIVKKLEDCMDWINSNLDAWRLAWQADFTSGSTPLLTKGIKS